MRWGPAACLLLAFFPAASLNATELAVLNEENWKQFVVRGKEADCIYGDYVLRNDRITAVIAAPKVTRNANMTVRNVGWAIIDLTQRSKPNDQLSAFYPGSLRYSFSAEGSGVQVQVGAGAPQPLNVQQAMEGGTISITCAADAVAGRPSISVRYTLRDGDPFVLVETIYENGTDKEYAEELTDTMRADGTFEFGADQSTNSFWANDDWFRQTYCVVCPDYTIEHEGNRGVVIRYKKNESPQISVGGGTTSFARKLFPAATLLESRGIASELAGRDVQQVNLRIQDARGAVRRARIEVALSTAPVGSGRTDGKGRLSFPIEAGEYQVRISALGRPQKSITMPLPGSTDQVIDLEPCGYVVAQITVADNDVILSRSDLLAKASIVTVAQVPYSYRRSWSKIGIRCAV